MGIDPKKFVEKIPIKYIAFVIVVVVVFALATTYFVDLITKNLYDAGYFTVSVLFDTIGVNTAPAIIHYIPIFSADFWPLFSILIMDGIIKIVAIGFLLAGIIDLITNIKLRERLSHLRMRQGQKGIIVCGYSMLAERLCMDLSSKNMNFIVVDNSSAKIDQASSLNYRTIFGNFTSESVLSEAGISSARAIIFSTESDFENLLGIITARHANQDILIIARAKDELAVPKMHRAGASLCIVPEILAGLELGNSIKKAFKGN